MSTETTASRGAKFSPLIIRSALLTPVVQWLYLMAMSLFSKPNTIACTNWHGEMMDCTIASALLGNVINVVLLNVLSLGLALVIAFGISMIIVYLIERFLPASIKGSGAFWIGVVCAFAVVVMGRVEQIRDLRAARYIERSAPASSSGSSRIIIESSRGAKVIDPQPAAPPRAGDDRDR